MSTTHPLSAFTRGDEGRGLISGIRILVLDHGKVVEFGTPWDLIQKDGMFRELCRQSGEDAQLMEVREACRDHPVCPLTLARWPDSSISVEVRGQSDCRLWEAPKITHTSYPAYHASASFPIQCLIRHHVQME